MSVTASPDCKRPAINDVPLHTINTADDDTLDKIEDTLADKPHNGITDISVPNGLHAPASSLDTS